MKKLLITILLISGLWSCGPSHYLKKAERALKKAEQLGANVKSDTVFIEKQVIVPEVKTDTVFKSRVGDTVYISKEKLKIKYVKLPSDSVFIEGKCKSDTVEINVPYTVTKEIKSGASTWDLVILGTVLFVIGFFVRWVTLSK